MLHLYMLFWVVILVLISSVSSGQFYDFKGNVYQMENQNSTSSKTNLNKKINNFLFYRNK